MDSRIGQFDVVQVGNVLVVVIDSDLLDTQTNRVGIPLVRAGEIVPLRHLNPIFVLDGRDMMLLPQQMTSLPTNELDDVIGTLAHERDRITRAIDTLLLGI